ncbi:MAG: HAD family hydrolase [Janthinobacterium lividum]
MIYATPNAQAKRTEIDALIFDMDGVLIDISRSIRVVNCLAIPYYLRTVLGWPAPDDLLTSADIELFKNAGGFNDDVDLSYALVLFYIYKGRENPSAAPETLNVFQPNLNRFAARVKERGGGVKAAEYIVFEHLTRDDKLAIETDYRKHLIKQIFLEMFAGEHSRRIYGFAPTLYMGPGYINYDQPLLDLAKLPAGKTLGIMTGRSFEEARFGLELCGLAERIPAANIITQSDGFKKPHPGGLVALAKRLGFAYAAYVGDTWDDLRTVQRFNANAANTAHFMSIQVLSGPAGKVNERLFRTSGADVIAADVNEALGWLQGE